MYCPSCGKPIPEESVFCMYCGENISGKAEVAPQSLIINSPTVMSEILIYFNKEMRQSSGSRIGRKIQVFIKLLDKDGKSTSYDGTIKIRAFLEQFGDTTSYTYPRGRIDEEFQVKNTDFYRATKGDGQIWFKFAPERWFDVSTTQHVLGKLEVWFTPWDKKDKKDILYRTANIDLRSTD